MADIEKTAAMLLHDLAAPDPLQRREVAKELRSVAETFARSGHRSRAPDASPLSRSD